MPRTRVFVGASLDGFIAGPNDELDWLSGGTGEQTATPSDAAPEPPDTFGPFLAQIGAVLMGRRTYEIVCGMKGPWPYGELPMLIATSRGALGQQRPTARAVTGSIAELVTQAKQAAGERDVYIDGGQLIRSALDAALVDEITVTIVPIIIGKGIPLFAGAARHHSLQLLSQRAIRGAAVELTYAPRR
jgi:dihydrofolate reductase